MTFQEILYLYYLVHRDSRHLILPSRIWLEMKKILSEIQSGQFAKEWMEEHKSGQTKFKVMRKQQAEHPIEEVGEKLRTLMPWIAEGKMVDKLKN